MFRMNHMAVLLTIRGGVVAAVFAAAGVGWAEAGDTSGSAVVSAGVTSATIEFHPGLAGDLERIVAAHRGRMALSYKNLDTGESVQINGDQEFRTASTIKTAVMCAAFDELSREGGRFKGYYDSMPYDDSTSQGGSGFIRCFRNGTKVELKEMLHMMITASDNVGTNMLVEWLGGLQRVNDWLAAHGFEKTRMTATIGGKLVVSKELREKWGIGCTTANEMARLMEMIVQGEAGTPAATNEMLRILGHQYFDACIASGVPPTVWVGSKSGSLNDLRADNAVVGSRGGRYVLSVYTDGNEDKRWVWANEGEQSIRAVSRAVYRHVNPTDAWEPPIGVEKF